MKREFDTKIWKAGNSYVVTIPIATIEKFNLADKNILVAISDEDNTLLLAKKGRK